MAFVNEKLTNEEREEFKKRAIVRPVLGVGFLAPLYWTIDRENNMWLIEAGVQRDFHDEHYFVFLWKGETYIISFIKEYVDDLACIRWSKKAHVSEYTFSVNAPFVNDLRNALMVFKSDGRPNELNESLKAICDF